MSRTPASRVHLPACLLTATLLAGAMATNSRSEYQKAWQERIVQIISGKGDLDKGATFYFTSGLQGKEGTKQKAEDLARKVA